MTTERQDRISALPADLQEKLRKRLAGQGAQAGIPVADRSVPLPLSFAQQRLWFIEEFEPGTATYNSAVALRLAGPLDVAALGHALDGLAARHESLRTTFDNVDGTGVQVIHPAGDLAIPLTQVTAAPGEVDGLLARECARPFDLRQGRCSGRCWSAGPKTRTSTCSCSPPTTSSPTAGRWAC